MTHYELILLFQMGFAPYDVHRKFGFSLNAVYRMFRAYRLARIEALRILGAKNYIPLKRQKKLKNRDV